MTRESVRDLFFPRTRSVAAIVAATLAWSAAVLLLLSTAAVVAVLGIYRGGTDHGASAFAVGGVFSAVLMFAGSVGIRRMAASSRRWLRLAGAAVLVSAAFLCSFYPVAWLRDRDSFPFIGALMFTALGLSLLAGAWSFARRR